MGCHRGWILRCCACICGLVGGAELGRVVRFHMLGGSFLVIATRAAVAGSRPTFLAAGLDRSPSNQHTVVVVVAVPISVHQRQSLAMLLTLVKPSLLYGVYLGY